MKVKNDHRSKFFQLKQLERRSLKKKIRASTGNPDFFSLLHLGPIYITSRENEVS